MRSRCYAESLSHYLPVLHLLYRAALRTFSSIVNRKPNISLWEGPKHLTQVRNNQCLGFSVIRSPCHNITWPQSWTLCSSRILLLYFRFISFCASSADSKTLHRVCFHSLLCHAVGGMLSQGSFRAGEKINICSFGKPIKLIICGDLKSAHTPTEDATWCFYQAVHLSGIEYLSDLRHWICMQWNWIFPWLLIRRSHLKNDGEGKAKSTKNFLFQSLWFGAMTSVVQMESWNKLRFHGCIVHAEINKKECFF